MQQAFFLDVCLRSAPSNPLSLEYLRYHQVCFRAGVLCRYLPERIFEKRREKKKEERKGGKKEREKGGREEEKREDSIITSKHMTSMDIDTM